MTTYFRPLFSPALYVPFTSDSHLPFDILVSLYTQGRGIFLERDYKLDDIPDPLKTSRHSVMCL